MLIRVWNRPLEEHHASTIALTRKLAVLLRIDIEIDYLRITNGRWLFATGGRPTLVAQLFPKSHGCIPVGIDCQWAECTDGRVDLRQSKKKHLSYG
jgi:hypothetical protein